ncbi:MAG: VIT and VWA domain-containing protein, partial [Pirellulales bacterium]
HAGGSLVVVDPQGQETRLSLRKYHVDVHIEDGFARTTIDQTYFNHLTSRQEGTFHFPLPGEASISRLAMYVSGRLMEGGMIERNRGRDVFETIKYRSLDPALLEWVDGSTFKMRVFPLEGREEKRIVLSYTQRLDSLYGQLKYRFPAGHSLGKVGKWSAQVHVEDGASWDWHSDSHQLDERKQNGHLVLSASAEDVRPDRDLVLQLSEQPSGGQVLSTTDVAQFSTATHEGFTYLMLRHQPQLDSRSVRPHRDWVFLFEASADRNPLLARVQVDAVKTILDHAEHDDTFSIVTIGTRATLPTSQPLLATPDNVTVAIDRLEQTHLVGALDLEQGLIAAADLVDRTLRGASPGARRGSPDPADQPDRRSPSSTAERYSTGRPSVEEVSRSGDHATARPVLRPVPQPVIVHLGSGSPVLGNRAVDQLTELIPSGAQYVGVAVGKRWNREFMRTAAANRSGYFTQINPDETVSWRTFDLVATLDTPRLLEVAAEDPQNAVLWLSFDQSLAQGEQLAVVARLESGQPLPKSVVLTGRLDGEIYHREIPVSNVEQNADYLPRMWAKLE